jgi:hypothetical protein
MSKIQIVFDGAGPNCQFVEVEKDGKGTRFGEWLQRTDGLWALEFEDPRDLQARIDRLTGSSKRTRDELFGSSWKQRIFYAAVGTLAILAAARLLFWFFDMGAYVAESLGREGHEAFPFMMFAIVAIGFGGMLGKQIISWITGGDSDGSA